MGGLMNGWRTMAALAVVLGVAACGDSHKTAPATSNAGLSRHTAVPAPLAVILPASSNGPTTCTVYEPDYATQVVFDSQSLNVSAECQAWSSKDAGDGYLWGYEPANTGLATPAITVCHLRDPSGRVTASVIEDTGFAPLSPVERAKSASACTSMLAAGWLVHRAATGPRS
jgi:hypothetical protein